MTAPLHSNTPKPTKVHTLAAYLVREAKAAYKSCFYNGTILKMAGAKLNHNRISTNFLVNIGIALQEKEQRLHHNYELYSSDQKIYIADENTVVYPDALTICGEPEFWNGREDLLTNPLLVVEVLSKSTQMHDRGSKFMLYKSLPSFKEYVLVAQDEPKVEVWTKTAANTWQFILYTNLEDLITLHAVEGITIPLASIYKNVKF